MHIINPQRSLVTAEAALVAVSNFRLAKHEHRHQVVYLYLAKTPLTIVSCNGISEWLMHPIMGVFPYLLPETNKTYIKHLSALDKYKKCI